MKSNRIEGIDLARSLAIIGMIIVNFKMVIGAEGNSWLLSIANALSGKAAALFVTLAGVGIALMTKKGFVSQDNNLVRSNRIRLIKRSVLLFVIGLSYIVIWPADILHFYGVYMLVALLFISSSKRKIFFVALSIILLYPFMMWMMSYDTGWNFETLDYKGFWTVDGFIRNLFYNGFHPVFPWVSFMLIGLWYGRHDLHDRRIVSKLMIRGWLGFVVLLILSKVLLYVTQSSDPVANEQLSYILGLSPMPPLPLYMLAGCSLSISVISGCILMADRFSDSFIIQSLVKTGKLALTLYVAHVVLGMGLALVYDESMIDKQSIQFTMCYAAVFSMLSIIFSTIWLKYFRSGPLEWLFKKILG